VLAWWKENPADWRALRQKIHDRYTHHAGTMRDRNGYELNTASTIAALLLGKGDFVETLRLAFNLGWDADNNAATCGAILGVVKGRRWMDAQGWVIVDRYTNKTRDGMPADETITGFGDKLVALARRVIATQGGEEVSKVVRIRVESPANVEPLPRPLDRMASLRKELLPAVERGLTGSKEEQARAAYLAVCLGEGQRLYRERPREWDTAMTALQGYPAVLRNLKEAPDPAGMRLRARVPDGK
jgi:hypothetical protein